MKSGSRVGKEIKTQECGYEGLLGLKQWKGTLIQLA
jgi:hypothetical protein